MSGPNSHESGYWNVKGSILLTQSLKQNTGSKRSSIRPELRAIAKGDGANISEDQDPSLDDHGKTAPVVGSRFSRTMINFWLDTLLMVAFVTLSIIAVIVQFVFPPGVAAKGWLLWGMNYGQWCSLQFSTLAVLGFGVIVHVMLHWTWVCGVIARKLMRRRELPDDGIRTVYGVGLLIALLLTGATLIGFAMLTIQMPPQ